MRITSDGFEPNAPIPARFAFGKHDPRTHVSLSDNRNPQLTWADLPDNTRSLVLICVDDDVPSKPDDVNQEGRVVPAELPRCDFYHWVMVDIPPDCSGIAEGACSNGVTAGGKKDPPGPAGSRQGINDYTGWFSQDAAMRGEYCGYDGPGPPWNDSIVHHYHFRLYALNVDRCPVQGAFTAAEVLNAIRGHILAEAEITGTYSLNPDVPA